MLRANVQLALSSIGVALVRRDIEADAGSPNRTWSTRGTAMLGAGLAPVSRRAVANVKRLRRHRL
jgi:hypothetical protein